MIPKSKETEKRRTEMKQRNWESEKPKGQINEKAKHPKRKGTKETKKHPPLQNNTIRHLGGLQRQLSSRESVLNSLASSNLNLGSSGATAQPRRIAPPALDTGFLLYGGASEGNNKIGRAAPS